VAEPAPAQIRRLAREAQGRPWVVFRAENADRALDMLSRGESGLLTDREAGDPRSIGYRGAYPQVNTGLGTQSGLLAFARMAYQRSAPAKVIVDRVAASQWASWFELRGKDEAFIDAVEAWMKNPTGRPGGRPLWWYFKRAQRLARRDGRCLLYWGLREGGAVDPAQKPGRVQGVDYILLIREEDIVRAVVDDDPNSPGFTTVKEWELRARVGQKNFTLKAHADRVLAFIPDPDELDETRGVSPLISGINYVEALENMLYNVLEAYQQEATPYIMAIVDGETAIDQEKRASIKASLAQLRDPLAQRPVFQGVKVEVLQGSGQLADPEPHWDIALDVFSMATGMSKSELRGDAAGELASAKENSRRWAGLIAQLQEEDNDPIVNQLLHRLREWDVTSWAAAPPDVEVAWNPIYREDAKTTAETELVLAQARGAYFDRKVPLPEELAYEVSEDPEMAAIVAQAQASQPPFPRFESSSDRLGPSPIEGTMRRLMARLRGALHPAYQAAAAAAAGPARDTSAAPIESQATREELARVLVESFDDAVTTGANTALSRLDRDEVYRALDTSPYRSFRSLSPGLADSVAQRLAERVRERLAAGIAQGMSSQQLADLVMEDFAATRVDAERIARTEGIRAYNQGGLDAMRQAGVERCQFQAFADADQGDPDGVCQSLNGRVFRLEEAPLIPDATHPNCKCALVPYLGPVP